MAFTFDGKEYATAGEVKRAKRMKALGDIVNNRGLRSKLWNLFSNKEQKDEARKNYESMMQGGSGMKYY